jgi:hypothetical protein
VPFGFLKRGREAPPAEQGAAAGPEPASGGIRFDGITEDWRLVGRMLVEGRLSDVLNRREPIAITDVSWAPIDGSEPLAPAPGLKSIDPYDLVLVLSGSDSMPVMSEEERAAHRVHKVNYEVGLEVPPYRVVGTIALYPGTEPERLLDRSPEMFIPVVGATVTAGDRVIGEPELEVVLVNRAYLRGVEQVDARTGERPEKLPGAPMGGVNWTDRAR